MNCELIVALDVDSRDAALRLRDQIVGVTDFFKVGKELFTAIGPSILDDLSECRVFLDLKFHDIPNTVARAVQTAARAGVEIVNVHVSGGRTMLEAARAAADSQNGGPLLYGVTVLTHLDDNDLLEVGIRDGSREQVVRLAQLATDVRLDGVVASAWETELVVQESNGQLDVIVPGVRPVWASNVHDQKRVSTPGDAARAGARFVVVGRSITQSKGPRDAAKRVVEELDST